MTLNGFFSVSCLNECFYYDELYFLLKFSDQIFEFLMNV